MKYYKAYYYNGYPYSYKKDVKNAMKLDKIKNCEISVEYRELGSGKLSFIKNEKIKL
jgi:hypothetical protein